MGFKKHAPGCKCGCGATIDCPCPTPPNVITVTPIGGPRPSYYREVDCTLAPPAAGQNPTWTAAAFVDNGSGTLYHNFVYFILCFPASNNIQSGFNLVLRSFQSPTLTGTSQTHFQVRFRFPQAGNECAPLLATVHTNILNSPVAGNTFHLSDGT